MPADLAAEADARAALASGPGVAEAVTEVVEPVVEAEEQIALAAAAAAAALEGEHQAAEDAAAPWAAPAEASLSEAATEAGAPAPEAAAAAAATRAAPLLTGEDDLEIIEGIGPKIAGILRENGIRTFADLGAADPARLRAIDGGCRLAAFAWQTRPPGPPRLAWQRPARGTS